MTKYHIKADGTPGVCRAKTGNCPLGGEGEHFKTAEEATQAGQEKLSKEMGMGFSPKETIRPKGKLTEKYLQGEIGVGDSPETFAYKITTKDGVTKDILASGVRNDKLTYRTQESNELKHVNLSEVENLTPTPPDWYEDAKSPEEVESKLREYARTGTQFKPVHNDMYADPDDYGNWTVVKVDKNGIASAFNDKNPDHITEIYPERVIDILPPTKHY